MVTRPRGTRRMHDYNGVMAAYRAPAAPAEAQAPEAVTTMPTDVRRAAELSVLKGLLDETEGTSTALNCWTLRRSPDAATFAVHNTGPNEAMVAAKNVLGLPVYLLGASEDEIGRHLLSKQLDDTATLNSVLRKFSTYLSERKELLLEGSPIRMAMEDVLARINGNIFVLNVLSGQMRSNKEENHALEEHMGPDGKPANRVVGEDLRAGVYVLHLLLIKAVRSYDDIAPPRTSAVN